MAEVPQNIQLKSLDGQVFEVPRDVAFRMEMVKNLVTEVESTDEVIPLQNVKAKVLASIIEFCKHHAEVEKSTKKEVALDDEEEEDEDYDEDFDLDEKEPKAKPSTVSDFDKQFVDVPQHELFELMLAANYLNVKDLLDLLIETVADMIVACKDPAEIREKFNITNDLSPEDVEDIKKKNTWAFE